MQTAMKPFRVAVMGLLLAACASSRPSGLCFDGPMCDRVEELHQAEHWPQPSAYAAELLHDVDLET